MKSASLTGAALIGAMLYLVALSAGAEGEARVPFSLPTPDGWRTETIPFPLGFAPELDYTGLEELRFAPGMFTPGAEDYWTYAFVWWIPLDVDPGVERLQTDLESYFFGLTRVVARSNGFDPGNPTFEAKLGRVEEDDPARLRGHVLTFDAFAARKAVELNVRVEDVPCEDEGRRALVFLLSPRPEDHAVWDSLREIRDGFRCN